MPGQAVITIRDKQWQVSLATALWDLQRGLGGITGIPAGTGTLFDMGWQQIIQVSTVPMLFPLDIAFLSDSMVVTEVYRNITPGYLVTSELQARYFLEVNAGELDSIDAGDKASVELLAPVAAPLQIPSWVQAMFSFIAFAVMATFVFGIARSLTKGLLPSSEGRQSSEMRRLGEPKTEAERKESHERKYGTRELPKRGKGLGPHHSSLQTKTGLTRKWYENGLEAGRTDGWMDIENTMKETQERHHLKEASDLLWMDIEEWETTDHFSILYGSKMMADAEGDYDLYADLKSGFWRGYIDGRNRIGIDIYLIARNLVEKTRITKRYRRPYLANWQYGGYSYVEEDPAKPEELWAHGMVDYAAPEDVIAIAEREGLSEISLAGGFWEEIGYKGYGEKVNIGEATKALAKAREHVLGEHHSSNLDVVKQRIDWLYNNQFASFTVYRDAITEAIDDREAGRIPRTETLRAFTVDELRSLKEYADELWQSGHHFPGIIVLPRLPEEAKGDFLFYEYIRDLSKLRKEPITEEEAKLLWEGWKHHSSGPSIPHHSPPFTPQDLEAMERYLELASKLTKSAREVTK